MIIFVGLIGASLLALFSKCSDTTDLKPVCVCVCVYVLHRNWCAFVVTKTVSCVVEDGVETYVKPDYHPCSWGGGQCSRVVA